METCPPNNASGKKVSTTSWSVIRKSKIKSPYIPLSQRGTFWSAVTVSLLQNASSRMMHSTFPPFSKGGQGDLKLYNLKNHTHCEVVLGIAWHALDINGLSRTRVCLKF